MSLVTRPEFLLARRGWRRFAFQGNFDIQNVCEILPRTIFAEFFLFFLKIIKKVRLRCEKLPIVDLIIGRPFAVAPFPMVPIFDVLQQKKYLVTPDVFRGAWVG